MENIDTSVKESERELRQIKVSVVMPVYNADEYLSVAIESVLSQTLNDIELICIDDGSTDKSLEIIKKFQLSDDRIRIVTENNAGQSVARNKGIVRARGEFIIFLDADDFFEPTLISSLYELAVEHNLDIAVAKYDNYNNKQGKFQPSIDEPHSEIFKSGVVASKNECPDYILQSTTGYVWNKLFRTSFIREKELSFAPELYVFEDVHFVCCALSLAERVARVDSILIHHRIYSTQSRAKLFKKYYSQVPVVYLQIKDFLARHGMYIPLSRSFLNFSAGRCYKIYNLLWRDAKEKFWDTLHYGNADSLGWFKHEPSDFEDRDVYEFVCNVGLYTNAQYNARTDKGRSLRIDRFNLTRFTNMLKGVRLGEKIYVFIKKVWNVILKPFKKVAKLFKKNNKTEE